MSGVSIRLAACAKTFADGTRALEPLDLEIARGETVVFLGPSGCGKTTTLRMIAGLDAPDPRGRILFDGEDVTPVPIERRQVGMVFQSYALFPNMNVADNIGYGLKIRGVSPPERKARVADLVRLVGIEGLETRSIDQLSGGQRQRVALARAVAVRPRVLLLDEPLTALDAALRERLRTELNTLLRSLGITTVYVTHDQAEAMALGDRIVVMSKGRIAQIGSPRDVYFRPASRFVAEFIGAANILEGTSEGDRLTIPGGSVRLPDGTPDGIVTVMARPEAFQLVPLDGAAIRGRVAETSFTGDRLRLVISGVGTRNLTVDVPSASVVDPGQEVGLSVDPNALRLLPSA